MLAICEPEMKSLALRRDGANRMLRTLDNPAPEVRGFAGPYSVPKPEKLVKWDTNMLRGALRPALAKIEADRPKPKPAQQEALDANGG